MYAETRAQAREAIARFAGEYGAKYPKAVTTLQQDTDALLTFTAPPSCQQNDLELDRPPGEAARGGPSRLVRG